MSKYILKTCSPCCRPELLSLTVLMDSQASAGEQGCRCLTPVNNFRFSEEDFDSELSLQCWFTS